MLLNSDRCLQGGRKKAYLENTTSAWDSGSRFPDLAVCGSFWLFSCLMQLYVTPNLFTYVLTRDFPRNWVLDITNKQ